MSFDTIMILGGVALLAMTAWNVITGEPTLVFLWDSWRALDINRENNPLIFWFVMASQASLALFLFGFEKAIAWLPF